ncbi:MAG TPA: peptidylprolyl isomerase [Bacteroidales bacterium]|nr:peptidylprolyl isomerase [Bacteroidales bacterium]HSA42939.1 peptidylprolyl isomerase [Bacteroidales bacterium]
MKTLFLRTTGLLMLLFSLALQAQNGDDPVLMTIAGSPVTKSEFLNIYQKNNVKGEVIDKKSLDEYVELFINFKLKVREAEELGMDTVGSFITELGGYRKQLAQKYMVDEEVTEKLILEAYDRMQKDVRASHILIKCDQGASPKDSLEAYNKIKDFRERILKGESFEAIARQYSDDLSARDREPAPNRPMIKGNGGDLGYFTAFDMVYPFETAAFNTPKGQISQIIRTEYGYHILKVTDVKKAMGKARAAHIFISMQQAANAEDSAAAREKIFDIYQKLKGGADWDSLAKVYSDDKGTAPKGGILPWFGVNRMVPDFILKVSDMKQIGDVSEPITTPFGWHIIKLLERKEPGSLEDTRADIKQKVTRDTRSQLSKKSVVEKIKKQYGFVEYPAARQALLPLMDSTLFQGSWDLTKTQGMNSPVAALGNKAFTQAELAAFLSTEAKSKPSEDLGILLANTYDKFVDESCLNYKDSKLESEFPEFRNLMKEYRDGILLFDLTDKKVWTKAVKDTSGLEQFYNTHKNDYQWGERLEAVIIKGKNQAQVEKAFKMAQKQLRKGSLDTLAISSKLNKDPGQAVKFEQAKYAKGDQKWIDNTPWISGVYPVLQDEGQWYFVNVMRKLDPEPKSLNEARGLVTADYQAFLEKEWIETLRNKYPVTVNKEVLSSIR